MATLTWQHIPTISFQMEAFYTTLSSPASTSVLNFQVPLLTLNWVNSLEEIQSSLFIIVWSLLHSILCQIIFNSECDGLNLHEFSKPRLKRLYDIILLLLLFSGTYLGSSLNVFSEFGWIQNKFLKLNSNWFYLLLLLKTKLPTSSYLVKIE